MSSMTQDPAATQAYLTARASAVLLVAATLDRNAVDVATMQVTRDSHVELNARGEAFVRLVDLFDLNVEPFDRTPHHGNADATGEIAGVKVHAYTGRAEAVAAGLVLA